MLGRDNPGLQGAEIATEALSRPEGIDRPAFGGGLARLQLVRIGCFYRDGKSVAAHLGIENIGQEAAAASFESLLLRAETFPMARVV
jgi:hypothetical protein